MRRYGDGHISLIPIHKPTAFFGGTMTRDSLFFVEFDWKLVVVAKFLTHLNIFLGINNNALGVVDGNDLRITVWTTTGIDIASYVSTLGTITHVVGINAKHVVAANLSLFIFLFWSISVSS